MATEDRLLLAQREEDIRAIERLEVQIGAVLKQVEGITQVLQHVARQDQVAAVQLRLEAMERDLFKMQPVVAGVPELEKVVQVLTQQVPKREEIADLKAGVEQQVNALKAGLEQQLVSLQTQGEELRKKVATKASRAKMEKRIRPLEDTRTRAFVFVALIQFFGLSGIGALLYFMLKQAGH